MMLLVMVYLNGCGRIVNPYPSDFTCPQAERGKCVGIRDAYVESFSRDGKIEEPIIKDYKINLDEKNRVVQGNDTLDSDTDDVTYIRKIYLQNLYNVLVKSFGDRTVPLLIPPKVVRLVILPYSDGGVFYDKRQVFVVIDDYKWLMDIENVTK